MLQNLLKVQELIAKVEPGFKLRPNSEPKLLTTKLLHPYDKLRIFLQHRNFFKKKKKKELFDLKAVSFTPLILAATTSILCPGQKLTQKAFLPNNLQGSRTLALLSPFTTFSPSNFKLLKLLCQTLP